MAPAPPLSASDIRPTVRPLDKAARAAGGSSCNPGDRRAQILASAIPVFAQHGFREASLDDIAAHAGITRAIVYRHFDSKEELYRAVLDNARTAIRGELQADQHAGPGSVTGLIHAAQRSPDRFRLLFGNVRHEPDFITYYEGFADASAQHVRDALPGEYNTPDVTEFVAHLITRQLFETILLWLDQNQPTTAEALADAIRAAAAAIRTSLAQESVPPDHRR
jgi:AcrR family transcriptional regulator